jgi:hypothetical protein
MADVKEVKVTLTEKDAKQFARSTTRKRKMKGGDDTSEIEDFRLNKLNGNEPKPTPDVAAALNPSATVTPNIVPVTTKVTAPVTIVAEKKTAAVSLNAPRPTIPLNGGSVPKIIHKKKHLTKAPTASVIRKPSLVIQPVTKNPIIQDALPKGGVTRRRKFTERKISVPIRSAAATRKQTHSTKEEIAKMPLALVRKMLLRKGLIKASANTPEEMARSLLLEYMLLHRAE